MHLVAARATPDVAVHLAALAATSAVKELHAAVAVQVVGVKEPAVEVVAGCLEALIDLLHGLLAPGCGGSGDVALRWVALQPPAEVEQLAADRVLLEEAGYEHAWHRVDADGDAGTEAAKPQVFTRARALAQVFTQVERSTPVKYRVL
jgi:hypothetical protein